MHQPKYATRPNGDYLLPWTYLHAMKDYSDMVAHLEAEPGARVVVNFSPVLLEQIDDYARQIDAYLKTGHEIRDPLLNALGSAVLPLDVEQRLTLAKDCLRANADRLINRFEHFHRLAKMADWFAHNSDANIYLNDQFLVDLLVWYHLAWLGEIVRRTDERVKTLINKAGGYTFRDRRLLIEVIRELISGVIGRYRILAERGQIELSVTPYAHPIIPLLLDINSAKEAMPDVKLPLMERYPGGEERVRWQIQHGKQVFEQYFGFTPSGCWPSEGSISAESFAYFQEAGFRWIASGERVICHSLHHTEQDLGRSIHRGFTLGDGPLACFFRDDGLSDLVGFTYSTWHADDAVANLVSSLEDIANANGDEAVDTVVSIILDGENAWEYYPENGYYFLTALYHQLANHPEIEMTTFSDCLNTGIGLIKLPTIVAGSWVYGTFSTWIGDVDKNRAWDMLGEAKRCFDRVMNTQQIPDEQRWAAERQLAICEGSDWFWWFGDYNPTGTVQDFDRLYRMQLLNLYQILGEEPPEYLSHAFAHGSGLPSQGGVMRRGSENY